MGNSYYEKGANHYDHHKELHIDTVNGGDIGKLVSAFFKDSAEDAEVVEEVKETDCELAHKTCGEPTSRPQYCSSTLSDNRKAILDHLLDLTDNGDWKYNELADSVKQMLRTVLGQGETPLAGKEAKMSETLWNLLENGRGNRVKIVWQNMVGYLDDKKLLRLKGAPALNKDFFGDDIGYTNIDKGRPSKGLMTADFESIIPLLDAYVPKLDKKA